MKISTHLSKILAIQPLVINNDTPDNQSFYLHISDSWNSLNVLLDTKLADLIHENTIGLGQVVRLQSVRITEEKVHNAIVDMLCRGLWMKDC